jgi:hypothetical protein
MFSSLLALKPGEIVIRVPEKLLITELVVQNTALSKAIYDLDISPTNAIALVLLSLKLRNDDRWSPYFGIRFAEEAEFHVGCSFNSLMCFFDILPRSFSTPLYWSQQERAQLQGTSLDAFASQRARIINATHASLVGALREYSPALLPLDRLTADEFRWALSVVWSRSFRVRLGEDIVGALVPLGDMFNMGAPVKVCRSAANAGGGALTALTPGLGEGGGPWRSHADSNGAHCSRRADLCAVQLTAVRRSARARLWRPATCLHWCARTGLRCSEC